MDGPDDWIAPQQSSAPSDGGVDDWIAPAQAQAKPPLQAGYDSFLASPSVPDFVKESVRSPVEGARNLYEDISGDVGAPTLEGVSGAATTALGMPVRAITGGQAGFGTAIDAVMNPLTFNRWGTRAEDYYDPLEQRFQEQNSGLLEPVNRLMEGAINKEVTTPHMEAFPHNSPFAGSTPDEISEFLKNSNDAALQARRNANPDQAAFYDWINAQSRDQNGVQQLTDQREGARAPLEEDGMPNDWVAPSQTAPRGGFDKLADVYSKNEDKLPEKEAEYPNAPDTIRQFHEATKGGVLPEFMTPASREEAQAPELAETVAQPQTLSVSTLPPARPDLGDFVQLRDANGAAILREPARVTDIQSDPRHGTFIQVEGQTGYYPINGAEVVAKAQSVEEAPQSQNAIQLPDQSQVAPQPVQPAPEPVSKRQRRNSKDTQSAKYTTPRMIGYPEDGSPPFTMAVLDMGNPAERAAQIWDQTAHLYTQKLSHYSIEGGAPSVENASQAPSSEPLFALNGLRLQPRTPTEVKAFHGTYGPDFERFDPSFSKDGNIYLGSSQELANQFAAPYFDPRAESKTLKVGKSDITVQPPGVGARVIPSLVETKNFKTVDFGGEDWHGAGAARMKQEIAKAKDEGFKGLVAKNVSDRVGDGRSIPGDQYITWTPGTVRSALSDNQLYALNGFHHGPEQAVENFPQSKATPQQWMKVIEARPGWKDYADWTGLDEFLAGKKSVSKDELLSYMRAHSSDLDERVLGQTQTPEQSAIADSIAQQRIDLYYARQRGEIDDPTYQDRDRELQDRYVPVKQELPKFEAHKIPGGEPGSYRELLIRDPSLGERKLTQEENGKLAGLSQQIRDLSEKYDAARASGRNAESADLGDKLLKLRGERDRLKKQTEPKYTSKHFNDQELAHVRFDDRVGPNGEKTLFINEVQSDLHQKGRTAGYRDHAVDFKDIDKLKREKAAAWQDVVRLGSRPEADVARARHGELSERLRQLESGIDTDLDKVPNAPFKGDLWLELALKRSLRYAVEHGYDAISWARSDQIAKAVGADPENLKLQYDSKIGKFLDKYTKKWGAKVERAPIVEPGEATDEAFHQALYRAREDAPDDATYNSVENAIQRMEREGYPREELDLTPEAKALVEKNLNVALGGSNQILRITPQMRESVMGGQAYNLSSSEKQEVMDALAQHGQYALDRKVFNDIHDYVKPLVDQIAPKGTETYVIHDIKEDSNGQVWVRYRTRSGKSMVFPQEKSRPVTSRGFWLPGGKALFLNVIRSPGNVYHLLGSVVVHEIGHGTREYGSLAPGGIHDSDFGNLVRHSNALGILDMPVTTFGQLIHDPLAPTYAPDKIVDVYQHGYAKLRQQDPQLYQEYMDQEAAFHMAQLYYAMKMDGDPRISMFDPVKRELETLLAGGYSDKPHAAQARAGAAHYAITAYHGSPHDFDRFDIGRIGTGEGAQAFGHGLYFAGNPKVAKSYQDALSSDGVQFPDGKIMPVRTIGQVEDLFDALYHHMQGAGLDRPLSGPARQHTFTSNLSGLISDAFYNADSSRTPIAQAAENYLRDKAKTEPDRLAATYVPRSEADAVGRAYQDAANTLQKVGLKHSPGRLYTVSLDVEPEDLLDWDKPLSEQSKKVRKSLERLGLFSDFDTSKVTTEKAKSASGKIIDKLFDARANIIGYISENDGKFTSTKFGGDFDTFPTKEKAVAWLKASSGRALEAKFAHSELERKFGDPASVSEALHKAGIPGIRYLDQGSRDSGNGTHNYVLFDDKLVKITAKDGKPVTKAERQEVLDKTQKPSEPQYALSDKERMANQPRTPTEVKVYRGAADHTDLDPSKTKDGNLYFTTSPEIADLYTEKPRFSREQLRMVNTATMPNVTPAYVETKDFMTVDMDGGELHRGSGVFREAKEKGYKGIVAHNVNDINDVPHTQIVVFPEGKGTVRSALSDNPLFALSGVKGAENLAKAGRPAAKEAISLAEKLEKQGKDRDQIWQETASYLKKHDPNLIGVFRGVDGKWRVEISDHNARMIKGTDKVSPLSDPLPSVYSHPDVYAAHPEIADQTRFGVSDKLPIGTGTYARMDDGTDRPIVVTGYDPKRIYWSDREASNVIPHEVEHNIQEIEGFPGGGTPNDPLLVMDANFILRDKINDLIRQAGGIDNATSAQRKEIEHLQQLKSSLFRIPGEAYRILAGEVEARNVQKRMNMTPDERRATPPWRTQEVSDEQQIIRYINNGPQHSISGGGKGGKPLDVGKLRSTRGKAEYEYHMSPEAAMEPQPYKGSGTFYDVADKVPEALRDRFQVHGIITGDVDANLLDLLNNGIDPNRPFNSGPPVGGSYGVDSTRTLAPYLIISDPGKMIQETGIKNVIVNGPAEGNIAALRSAYPSVNFMTAAESGQFMRRPDASFSGKKARATTSPTGGGKGGEPPSGGAKNSPPSGGGDSPRSGPPSAGGFDTTPDGPVGRALHNIIEKLGLGDVIRDVQMKATPMAVRDATIQSRAAAKDFANYLRRVQFESAHWDKLIQKEFSPEEQKAMWEAADEESVLRQQGKDTKGKGLSRLKPRQREVVKLLQERASEVYDAAKAVGIVDADAEGLPSYAPRMVVMAGESGFTSPQKMKGGFPLDAMGRNLIDTTPNVRTRKHLTTAQTEAAAKAKFGEGAQVVRNIRTLNIATSRLQRAVAGKALINRIKEIGRLSGETTVHEGSVPSDAPYKFFTMDHPAFKEWRADLYKDKDGKWKARLDEDGNPIFRQVPVYVRSDFEGPLRAVLSQTSGAIYHALMKLKTNSVGLIMYSPIIHNAVEFSRALPMLPLKMVTLRVYRDGYAAKNDYNTMREFLKSGGVPIGDWRGHGGDAPEIMNEPSRTGDQGWLSSGVRRSLGETAANGVNKAMHFWHQTLLWDRIADLQMGIYTNLRDKMLSDGLDRDAASKVAAHFANRYAGAVPPEAMSAAARKLANIAEFSRSFTVGNIGVMKDMFMGLPSDVQAQIAKDHGIQKLLEIKSKAKRKAIGAFLMDIALFYVMNSLLQNAFNALFPSHGKDDTFAGNYERRVKEYFKHWQDLYQHPNLGHLFDVFRNPFSNISATHDNEPGKQDRILVGYQSDGTGIYMRNPFGKIGEEFLGYLTSPIDMFKRKQSTILRPLMETIANDKGFGRKMYDPNAELPADLAKNTGKIVGHFMASQVPITAVEGGYDLATGVGNADTRRTAALQVLGPMVGLTFSKGYPGGPAQGEAHRVKQNMEFRFDEAKPALRDLIKNGNQAEARKQMTELGVAPGDQKGFIQYTLHPGRISSRARQNLQRQGSSEEKDRFNRALPMQ